ncbi:MAG: hypothetical protein NVSMB51_08800 [Solirubrobacteraceae bacterium]
MIREIGPWDKLELSDALARLSPASARARFLAPKSRFSAGELRYLTEVDGRDHCALVAIESGEIVGVARYVRLPERPDTAEAAVAICDELQGRGLGRRMGLLLADRARAAGVQRFTATMLADNAAAHRLFAAISARLMTEHHGEVDELVAELLAA